MASRDQLPATDLTRPASATEHTPLTPPTTRGRPHAADLTQPASSATGLAFDGLVEFAHELDEHELPLAFRRHLDEAARETGLYDAALHPPHLASHLASRLASADVCLRHLATATPPCHRR